MVDLERLATEARRVAARSRARMAARIGGLVALAFGVAVLTGGHVASCAGLALALFAVTAGLRWWAREGVDAARLGLAMGVVPLFAASLLPACGVHCPAPGQLAAVDLACVLAAAAAGIGIAVGAQRAAHRWRAWLLATTVASLTAALGCTTLGGAGMLFTVGSLAIVSAGVRIPLLARAA